MKRLFFSPLNGCLSITYLEGINPLIYTIIIKTVRTVVGLTIRAL